MKCEHCELEMPDRYIHDATIIENGVMTIFTGDPECIRKAIGKVHDVEDYQFTGKQAQYNHSEFMRWLKRYGE